MFAKSLFALIVAVFGVGVGAASALPIAPSVWTGQSYGGYDNLLLFKWENINSHDFHVVLEGATRVHAYAWKVNDDPAQGLPYVSIITDVTGHDTEWERSESESFNVGLYINDDFQDWRDYSVSWYQTDEDFERIPGTTGKYIVEPGSLGLIAIGLAALSLTRRTLRKSGANRVLPVAGEPVPYRKESTWQDGGRYVRSVEEGPEHRAGKGTTFDPGPP